MTRLTVLLVALLAWSMGARGQDCIASAQAPDAVWTAAPFNPGGGAPLKIMTHLRCLGCRPEVSMVLSAGPAEPALKNMPVLGQKAGIEWAKAIVEDPAQREGFRRSVMRSELHTSPGCSLQGRVSGVTEIGGFGLVVTDLQAECQQPPSPLSAEFYSGYDGQCMYQVQLIWGPGLVPLSPEGRSAVVALFESVRFGR